MKSLLNKIKKMSFDTIIQKLITKKSSFKKIYLQHDVHIEVSNLITAARIHKGLSQEELAKLVSVEQPSIARLESGKSLPNVSSLDKIAKALGSFLIIRFGFMEEISTPTYVLNIIGNDFLTDSTNVISGKNTLSADSIISLPFPRSVNNERQIII